MSTTRHRRQPWQKVMPRIATSAVTGADAMWIVRTENGLLHLTSLAFGVAAAALILGSCSYATSIGWHRGRHRYLVEAVANTPLRRPLHPIGVEHQDDDTDATRALTDAISADNWAAANEPTLELDEIRGPRQFMTADLVAASDGAEQ